MTCCKQRPLSPAFLAAGIPTLVLSTSYFPHLTSSGSSTRSNHPHTPFKPVVATTCNANSASVWGRVFLSLWFGFWVFFPPFPPLSFGGKLIFQLE